MRDKSDPKWKLPNMALKNLNPKYLQVTPHSEVHIPQDEPRRDSSVWYMKVASKLSKVEGHLSHKRTRYQGVIHRLSNQWINLVRSENHFRSLVISHNKFVRENMEKRQRAITRVQQSQRLIQVRQAEIKDLKHETDVARFLLTEMRREIEKHDKYDVFLTNLISLEHCPFRTVFDILKKYEMLQLVKAQREQEQSREMARVVRAHKHMKMMIYNGNVLVIGLRNGLNNVRCKFDDICRKNLATESLITSIVNRTNEISAEVSTCQYMIDAMYRYMCMRRKLPLWDLPLRDVKPKVDILKSTLAGWEKILTTADITIKGKKKRKGSRKSYAWKQSVSQGVFNWKKKPTPEAEMFQNLMMNSSLFKP